MGASSFIGIGSSLLGGGLGGMEEAKGQLEGAQTEADLNKLASQYQEELFFEDMARLKPRYEAALEYGMPMLNDYMTTGTLQGGEYTLANPDYVAAQEAVYKDTPGYYEYSGGGGDGFAWTQPDKTWIPATRDLVSEAVAAQGDPTMTLQRPGLEDMPLYQMQLEQGMEGLKDFEGNPFVENYFRGGLNAAENQGTYNRMNDMLQIGLGASESAGAGAQNFYGQQSQNALNIGNALSGGQTGAYNTRNSMYNDITNNLPAYIVQNTGRERPTNLQGPQVPMGGIR